MSRILALDSSPVRQDEAGSGSRLHDNHSSPNASSTSRFAQSMTAGPVSFSRTAFQHAQTKSSEDKQRSPTASFLRRPELANALRQSPGTSKPVPSANGSSTNGSSKRPLSISSDSDLSDASSPSQPTKKKLIETPLQKTWKPVDKSKNETIDISDDGSAESDRDFDDDDSDREALSEQKAVDWFNNADVKLLMDVIGITEKQAQSIIEERPFRDGDKVREKLRKREGVKPKMFDDCVECLVGLEKIDAVLAKCERLGRRLQAAFAGSQEQEKHSASNELASHRQPEGLADGVTLKDFQLVGVNWMWTLFEQGCSGILADDMGLGKTAQVIAFLNLATQRRDRRPHLIVVPSSVLDNWMREFQTFGPILRVFKYHGKQNERFEQRMELKEDRDDIDVVITTYDMASGGTSGSDKDHTFLRKFAFDACIFDEGHILKNRKSLKYAKLLRIPAKWRLILTGTPLQNNLNELISLLQFIMPTYFRGAEEALTQIFQVKQAGQLSEERVTRAKQMMQPFVLRRKKVDVLNDLQPKTERIKYCDMTPRQSQVYKETYAKSRAALLQHQNHTNGREKTEKTASSNKGKKGQGMFGEAKAGNMLIDLRKAANHPLLFRRLYNDSKIDALVRDYSKTEDYTGEPLAHTREDFQTNSDAELCMSIAMQYKECAKHKLDDAQWLDSGKIAALKEVIDEATSKGERVIIFSQFVLTLEIICRALEVLNVSYRGFTGSTDVNHRQFLVDEFTRDESISCFLLSTRAGGVGINLMAANWVVLFDQDYNPQNDRQAADRCYRIGQTKPVTIVRLISKGTIDEQVYDLGKKKLKLADRVESATSTDDAEDDEEHREAKVEQALLASLVGEP